MKESFYILPTLKLKTRDKSASKEIIQADIDSREI